MSVVKEPPPTAQSEEQWLRVWGQPFRVLIRPGRGPVIRPVVFINGVGTRADILDALVDTFDPSLEVIRFDPPGIGGTPPSYLPYGMPQMAVVVTKLLDQLGHDHVDVIGYSWGGVVAQQMALQSRARVRRLVLLSTNSGTLSVPGSMMSLAMMFSPVAAQVMHTDDKKIGQLYGGCARKHADAVRALLLPDFDNAGSGLFQQLGAATTWTTLPMVWAIQQPVLILAGTDDPMVPFSNAQLLDKAIPRSRLLPFDGGHLDPVLEPEWFGAEISAFLTQE